MIEEKLYCTGGGCTAKLGPKALERVLSKIKQKENPDLLVGFDSNDDAAIYKLSDDIAIVQTLDFFPALPFSPYEFGQIAATNALSDVFAMGGEAKVAMNIVAFPEKEDLNILGEIIEGSTMKVQEAGATVAGGHSIVDKEIKYGLSVTGTVHPDKYFRNNGVKPGDCLILTKPLGVGIINTAIRMDEADESSKMQALKSMTKLNLTASRIMRKYPVNACTDVTGFGLLVHLSEMIGDFGADVYKDNVPYFHSCDKFVNEFFITAAGQRNRNFINDRVDFNDCGFVLEEVLCDPQTSGGLLVSMPEKVALEVLKELIDTGHEANIVGLVHDRDNRIRII